MWTDPAGKISKDITELNRNINQLDIINIYRALYPATVEYTLFSSSHRTFTRIDHILDQHNIEKEKQSLRNNTTQLQDLLRNSSNQENIMLVKELKNKSGKQNRDPRNISI